jgi:hypothetical protein
MGKMADFLYDNPEASKRMFDIAIMMYEAPGNPMRKHAEEANMSKEDQIRLWTMLLDSSVTDIQWNKLTNKIRFVLQDEYMYEDKNFTGMAMK